MKHPEWASGRIIKTTLRAGEEPGALATATGKVFRDKYVKMHSLLR